MGLSGFTTRVKSNFKMRGFDGSVRTFSNDFKNSEPTKELRSFVILSMAFLVSYSWGFSGLKSLMRSLPVS